MRRPLKFLSVLGAALLACSPIGAQTAKIYEGDAKPAIQPLRSAVARAMVGQSFVSGLASSYVQGQSRMRMSLGDAPLSELRVCYGNWAGPHEAAGSGNITVEAAVESDGLLGGGRFTWSGANTVTLTPGQTACSTAGCLVHPPLPPPPARHPPPLVPQKPPRNGSGPVLPRPAAADFLLPS